MSSHYLDCNPVFVQADYNLNFCYCNNYSRTGYLPAQKTVDIYWNWDWIGCSGVKIGVEGVLR